MDKRKQPQTEEHKRKISESNKGKHEHLIGRIVSEETREKIGLSNSGKKRSEATKQKMSLMKRGKPSNFQGHRHSEETKKKIGLIGKGRPAWNKGKPSPLTAKRNKENPIKLEKHPNWQGGKSFELYGFDWTELLKHSIRTRDCFTCQICGKNGFVVHHIDYNKKNCNPENLITLCRSCHTKTNYNREYWMEYFNNYLT